MSATTNVHAPGALSHSTFLLLIARAGSARSMLDRAPRLRRRAPGLRSAGLRGSGLRRPGLCSSVPAASAALRRRAPSRPLRPGRRANPSAQLPFKQAGSTYSDTQTHRLNKHGKSQLQGHGVLWQARLCAPGGGVRVAAHCAPRLSARCALPSRSVRGTCVRAPPVLHGRSHTVCLLACLPGCSLRTCVRGGSEGPGR